jgi:ABC-type glycerol-3-phosphate transport system substrate-binding protein
MAHTVRTPQPDFVLFEQMVAGQSPDVYAGLCEGKVRFTDVRVKQAFRVWADLIAKGYFTDPSTDLFSEVPRRFRHGEVAMVPCGSWYYTTLTGAGVPGEDIDIFVMPPANPSAGKVVIMEASPILIARKAPNLASAMKVADYWMGPEGSAAFARLSNRFPPNCKSDTSFLPPQKVALQSMIVKENYRVLNRYGEATPTPIGEKAADRLAEFLLKPDSVDAVLADLDKIAAEYWSGSK